MTKITFRARFATEELVQYAQLGVAVLAVFFLLFLSVAHLGMSKSHAAGMSKLGIKVNLTDESLSKGPLALKQKEKSSLALFLENSLVFLAQSVRPDMQERERLFCVGLRGSEAEVSIREGDPIFFEKIVGEDGKLKELALAADDAELKLIPHVIDGSRLSLKMENGQEVILPATFSPRGSLDESVAALSDAKCLGQDLLFSQYGANIYRALSHKQKISLFDGANPYVLHVGAGDFLIFDMKRWKLIDSLAQADRDLPLAKIQEVGPSGVVIEAWDCSGYTLFQNVLKLERPLPLEVGQVISSPRLRSKTAVSCQLDKKKMLLKEGDWLLKTKSGFHKLADSTSLQAYLDHELCGELLVVDQIDPRGSLRIQYFNEMRTAVQTLSFPLLTEMKKTKAEKKKAVFLK